MLHSTPHHAAERTLPILIAGAVPTDLAAALDLTRFGLSRRLIDRLPTPFGQQASVPS
jgi:2-polyprenyl-6-methoxyphenol hydroxylase-like FAD-dependent oxidoreductase